MQSLVLRNTSNSCVAHESKVDKIYIKYCVSTTFYLDFVSKKVLR